MISGEISIFFRPSFIFKMFHKQYWTFFLLFFILILENGSVRYS